MAYEKDEVWGTPTRRMLATSRENVVHRTREGVHGLRAADDRRHPADAGDAFGPEAVVRAREMDYELTTRIQQESPYVAEQVVEHKVHDFRLWVGVWVLAGLSGVMAFLQFSVTHLIVALVALVLALSAAPGRQRSDDY